MKTLRRLMRMLSLLGARQIHKQPWEPTKVTLPFLRVLLVSPCLGLQVLERRCWLLLDRFLHFWFYIFLSCSLFCFALSVIGLRNNCTKLNWLGIIACHASSPLDFYDSVLYCEDVLFFVSMRLACEKAFCFQHICIKLCPCWLPDFNFVLFHQSLKFFH